MEPQYTKFKATLVDKFSSIPEVGIISAEFPDPQGCLKPCCNQIEVHVYYTNEVYDDKLMDRLIGMELEIHAAHPHLYVDFSFHPFVLISEEYIREEVFFRRDGI